MKELIPEYRELRKAFGKDRQLGFDNYLYNVTDDFNGFLQFCIAKKLERVQENTKVCLCGIRAEVKTAWSEINKSLQQLNHRR